MSGTEHDVFLSYASADIDIARRIRAALEDQQYSVWWDKGRILAGDDFLTGIFDAILGSRYFLIILTSNSARSNFVRAELSLAKIGSIERADVIVIPILYESCPIPPALRSIQFLDFTKSPREGLRQLIETLHAHELRRKGEETPTGALALPTLGDEVDKLTSHINEAKDLYVATDV